MRKVQSYLVILIIGVTVAACGGRNPVQEDVVVESVGGTAGTSSSTLDGGTSVSSIPLDDGGTSTVSAETDGGDDSALLNQRVVYFEYDSSTLNPESQAIVQAHARYLGGVSGIGIILEGHADERGTREYNLALGESRAKAVADLLQAMGLEASRVQTISYGEERPVSLGSDESAWSLNRRVEILYQ